MFLDHFWVSDGTVPGLASCQLNEQRLEGRRLRAVWRVDGELSRGAVALRSVDDDEFLRRAAFERTGENELVMLDSLPEEFVRVRYVLAGDEQGRLVSLSDTLVSQQGRDEPGVVRGIRPWQEGGHRERLESPVDRPRRNTTGAPLRSRKDG